MTTTSEQLHQASAVYFHLLKNHMVDKKHDALNPYFADPAIQEAVHIFAKQSGTLVLETFTKLHLVVEAQGSLYASNFSHLKENHGRIKSIPEMYMAHLLLMVLLSEIDGDMTIRNERELSGVGFYKWVELMDQTFAKWTKDLTERPELEDQWGIAITTVMDIWNGKHMHDGDGKISAGTKTKFHFCMLAAKLLEEEKLVRLLDDREQTIVYPTDDLYERLDLLYHDQERFKQVKEILALRRPNYASH
ncbi:DUF6063 family protein [Paenibacillus sp. FSL R7-0297]|uniref:DUF6063 family protein n=1 Tax=unclassified Paenibacillus TaxID=185978 RepID=UPI0003E24B30|nr:DUF6063 family protein [Paenibacillus sp. FSL R7-269]ETT49753.1 hypothetical protein C162_12733 [Paenibacillus sp. FSL R7-269]